MTTRNERIINDLAERSYMPAPNALGEMIKKKGNYFKVAFFVEVWVWSSSEIHAPQVLEKRGAMKQPVAWSYCEPYSHGLASLANEQASKPRCIASARR